MEHISLAANNILFFKIGYLLLACSVNIFCIQCLQLVAVHAAVVLLYSIALHYIELYFIILYYVINVLMILRAYVSHVRL
jgi:hypothetical protein